MLAMPMCKYLWDPFLTATFALSAFVCSWYWVYPSVALAMYKKC